MDWRGRVSIGLVRPNERAACFLFAKVDSSDSNQAQAWGSGDLRIFFFREPLELLIGHRPNMFDTAEEDVVIFLDEIHLPPKKNLM